MTTDPLAEVLRYAYAEGAARWVDTMPTSAVSGTVTDYAFDAAAQAARQYIASEILQVVTP